LVGVQDVTEEIDVRAYSASSIVDIAHCLNQIRLPVHPGIDFERQDGQWKELKNDASLAEIVRSRIMIKGEPDRKVALTFPRFEALQKGTENFRHRSQTFARRSGT
jgi:hypothetical protein